MYLDGVLFNLELVRQGYGVADVEHEYEKRKRLAMFLKIKHLYTRGFTTRAEGAHIPGQTCVTVFEEFADGSWAIFFEDCPNIIGGSNDSWEDALSDLAVIVRDILQDIEKYEDSVSLYQEERRQFIKKVFGL